MGQGLEMSVSHVFPDGSHFSEQINSDNLPYNIQNMDGKKSFELVKTFFKSKFKIVFQVFLPVVIFIHVSRF